MPAASSTAVLAHQIPLAAVSMSCQKLHDARSLLGKKLSGTEMFRPMFQWWLSLLKVSADTTAFRQPIGEMRSGELGTFRPLICVVKVCPSPPPILWFQDATMASR